MTARVAARRRQHESPDFHQEDVVRLTRRVRPEWVMSVAVAVGLSCGGGAVDNSHIHGKIAGVAYWGGPVEGATVVAYQRDEDGEIYGDGPIGTTTTGPGGTWSFDIG